MKRIAILLSALGTVLTGQLHANIITVGPAGGGYSYTSITTALAAATDGDTLRLAAATYSAATGESFPLTIDKTLKVEAIDPINQPHLQGDHLHTVISITVPDVTLRGLWITDGSGSEGIYGMDGGGICIFVDQDASGFVLLADCLIEQNTCPYDETYNGCGGGIYCGGTWCTCFEIGITNCIVLSNGIPVNNGLFGNGGGIFCGMLSKVWMEGCVIEGNSANDRGGGVFVDNYGLAMLKDSHVRNNISPGDPSRAGWGGKGGGLFLNGEAVCTVAGCGVIGNYALYYGGGLFTMSGLTNTATGGLCTNAGSQFFTMPVLSNVVSGSLVASNNAGLSGGGAYIRDHAYLAFQSTTNYWNNATQDGGGVCVAGGASGGGKVELASQCLLEGNECAGRGGGVYLGANSFARVGDTRFLGNSSDGDGGAVFLDSAASATLTNCLVTYNNAARGYGGGFRLLSTASAQLLHCSVVGNFAPWARSGFYLDTNAILVVTNSILWRNAGGSVQTNGGALHIAYSLDEDGPAPLTGSPAYVGWGTNTDIFVDTTSPYPGSGASGNPFNNLQVALDRFDFQLASNSPCINAASGGGNLGAYTGVGGAAGNIVATLRLASGNNDIRGRNIIFTRGLQGNGWANSTIWNAVFGYVENSFIRDLAITGERWFGGLVLRGSSDMDRCRVYANTALLDGGGIYICESNTVSLNNCEVGLNQAGLNGGGLFICSNTWVAFNASQIADNRCQSEGGGAYVLGHYGATNCVVARNTSTGAGGGLRLGGVGTIQSSLVASNTTHNHGGGIYVSGQLAFNQSTNFANRADTWPYHGGGMYVAPTGVVDMSSSCFLTNSAADVGGGLMINDGRTQARSCLFLGNSANQGGAVYCGYSKALASFDSCDFASNSANDGGAVWLSDTSHPIFTACRFGQNYANGAGGAACVVGNFPVFDDCSFTSNSAANNNGGALFLLGSGSLVLNCGFTNNRALYTSGGSVQIQSGDRSRLVRCAITGSFAGDSGGAINVREASTRPQILDVLVANSHAVRYGGGIACREAAVPSFEDVVITNCSAVLGGGIYADGTTSSAFERCRVYNNRAESTVVSADGGGAYFTDSAVGRLTHCCFQGNAADNDGAGFIALGTAALTVTSTWLVSNQATNTGGGAKFTASSSGVFQNCTIVGNSAITNGGGGLLLDSQAAVVIDSSIIYSNRFDGIAAAGGSLVVNWSCVQPPWLGGWSGIGNTNVNPMLDPAGFFLLDGSPCIDAGNPSPGLNDAALPPGKGTLRNDMGATGGPLNGWTPAASETLWIPAGGLWSYYDFGSDPAGNWCAVAYADSNWNYGLAKFGYGRDGEVTTVSFGTNAAQKFISTYFRTTFNVPDLATATNLGPLQVRLICVDGAVVYLNGVEAVRYNMPAGTIGYGTLASSDIIGADENRWLSFPLDPRLLAQGTNVVAIEVHLASPTCGDLGFDLQLATYSGFTPGPKTIYVNDDSTTGDIFTSAPGNDANTGLTPSSPLRSVSTALARYGVRPGDVIYVDAGLYNESVTIPSGSSGFTLIGAGMDRSIIDAGQTNNCLVLYNVWGATVRDLTLRHGKAATQLYGTVRGGALLCTDSDLYMRNVALRDSTAPADWGGGAWIYRSDAYLDRVVVSGNVAGACGGGLLVDYTRGAGTRNVLTNCVVSGNQAGDGGGGIMVSDGLVQACTINNNSANNYGGGGVFWGQSQIQGSSVTDNRANFSAGLDSRDSAAVRDCTIANNVATADGGGVRSYGSSTLSNCVFVGNHALNSGGAGNLWDSASTCNCTFLSNRASWGGGLTLDGHSMAQDCIFTNNTAINDGGGLRLTGSALASNCFVASNSATWGGGVSVAANSMLRDSVISNNTVSVESGGVRVWDSGFVSNCWIVANQSLSTGGGLTLHTSARGQYCVITNNWALNESGGARVYESASMNNCLIVANQSMSAGGVSIHSSASEGNCTITNNQAFNDGGGLRLYDSSSASNCLIAANSAGNNSGGALIVTSATLRNCTLAGNYSTNLTGGLGVAGNAAALDCVITNNTAMNESGGLRVWDSAFVSNCLVVNNFSASAAGASLHYSCKAQHCVITNNTATNDGGGVRLYDSATLFDSVVVANSAINNTGGGIRCDNSGLVQSCSISGNSALGVGGGGIYAASNGKVRNTLITGNDGDHGGGLYLSGGTAESCTITGNSAGKGGGLYLDSGAVSNTIIYFNQSINGSNYFNNSTSYSYSHCCTAPNIPNGIGIMVADPRFLNLAAGDFGLATNSPCIDAGINSSWMINAFDLAGKPRILNGFVDLGAYEAIPLTPVSGMRLGLRSPQPLGSNGFDFVLNSLPGLYCRVDASTDLLHWTTITNLISIEATTFFQDPAAANYSQRFYRAVVP
jgi:hypothetical protein